MAGRGREIVKNINKAVMALMLAANTRHLLRSFSGKSCYQYFSDFLFYLRETLSCPDYIALCSSQNKRKKDTTNTTFLQLVQIGRAHV